MENNCELIKIPNRWKPSGGHDIELFHSLGQFLIKAFVSCKPRLNIIKQAISSCEGPGTISQPFIGWVKLEKPIPRAIPRIPCVLRPNCKIHNHVL